jgi:hypothetical protein
VAGRKRYRTHDCVLLARDLGGEIARVEPVREKVRADSTTRLVNSRTLACEVMP